MKEDIDSISGVRVIMDDLENHPSCPHGPTILFERKQIRFYACSACRNRKDCPFYVLQESYNKKKAANHFKELAPLKTFSYSGKLIKKVKSVSPSQRVYCHTCSSLALNSDDNNLHEGHDVTRNIDDGYLLNPSKLLKPLQDSKKEAQYLFSDKSVDAILKVLQENDMRNIICLGTPRIHERIQQNIDYGMESLLLDIDGRHQMFYPSTKFIPYNIFNHHFFNGEKDKKTFEDFLIKDSGKATCLVMDPPFGGRIEPLSYTLRTISKQSGVLNNNEEDSLLPTILVMPYFMEPQIENHIGVLEMSDYQIAYENHSKFQVNQKSVVRMFTNIPLSKLPLPEDEGYKFCPLCSKWVGSWNKHCTKCKSCTSKNGTTYVHCNLCKKCVKSTWVHCSKCNRCHLSEHLCSNLSSYQICFNCQQTGHKKVYCPLLGNINKRKNLDPDSNHNSKMLRRDSSPVAIKKRRRGKK